MNIKIKLSELGPMMWFVGEPKDPNLIRLSQEEPGPLLVDFDSLGQKEAKKVVVGLRDGTIAADIEFEKLKDFYHKKFLPQAPTKDLPVEQDPTYDAREQKLMLARKKDEDMRKRCGYLIQKGIRAIKAALAKETDMRVLKICLTLETDKKENKQRQSVIDFLKEKMVKIQEERLQEAMEAASQQPSFDPQRPYAKLDIKVEETDQEIVAFANVDVE